MRSLDVKKSLRAAFFIMQMDIYEFDEKYRKAGHEALAGIDEAGRGPLAGPVVAAAVILPPGLRFKGLNDSKKVSEKNRKLLFFDIMASDAIASIGISGEDMIESHNILGATRLAMKEAVGGLSRLPDFLILDAVKLSDVAIAQEAVIKGDAKSACVAAASIVAKYVRDSIMIHFHKIYPMYGFDRHKGYGTSRHISAIRTHGPCVIHRKGFIRNVAEAELPLF